MTKMVPHSSALKPGTRLRHKDGHVVVLDRRKIEAEHRLDYPWRPGWWLRGNNGGLADFVIDGKDSDWTVLNG